jgi:ATP-dependent exoDNAse (exonuclease V) alpha subunit
VETKTINYLFTIILRLTYWSKQAKHNLILLHFTNYQYDTNVLTTGIFNGAKGTVVGFGFTSDPTTSRGNSQIEIPIVFVKMDDDNGYSITANNQTIIPFTARCDETVKYDKKYHRWQIPLKAAYATTTHKMQGSTAKGNCVTMPSENKPWCRGLDYVANSRAKDITKLFLLRPLRESNFTSHSAQRNLIDDEYTRLHAKFDGNA